MNIITETTLKKVNDFQLEGSGWTLCGVDGMIINNCKYECFNGSSFLSLPSYIDNKKATVNVQNDDNKCFLWSILAAIHYEHIQKNRHRVNKYQQYEGDLNMHGITYPVSIDQIGKFERQNEKISVNVYAYKPKKNLKTREKKYHIYPIRLTQEVKEVHVHLLLITRVHGSDSDLEDEFGDSDINVVEEIELSSIVRHYCYIHDLSPLLQGQLHVNNRKKKYFCDRCLNYFYSTEKRESHLEACFVLNNTRTTLPSEDEKMIEFKAHEKQLNAPFVIYAETEAILQPITDCSENENEMDTSVKGAYQKHIPHSIGYYLHSHYPNLVESRYEKYEKSIANPDCATWFVNELKKIGEEVYPILNTNKRMDPMSKEEETHFMSRRSCHICGEQFKVGDIRVRDHSHLSGKFRGAAHESCNLKYQETRVVPVIFHNLKYDLHFLIEKVAAAGNGNINVIPTSTENYISFTKYFDNSELNQQPQQKQYKNCQRLSFRFIDSFRFLAESLEALASNLTEHDLRITKSNWMNISDEQFKLIQRKGVYPYDYIKSEQNLLETSLPPIDKFYNKLNETQISQDDYDFAQAVWTSFNVQNILEYTDVYLRTDVLLLADVFENFRKASLESYGLDPAHYFTLPGYSWDAMLKITKVKIELIHGQNIDQLNFFEKGKRNQ